MRNSRIRTRGLLGLILLLFWIAVPAQAQVPEALRQLQQGAAALEEGQYTEALVSIRQSLVLDPDLCRARYYLVRALVGRHVPDDAAEASSALDAYRVCAAAAFGGLTADGAEEIADLQVELAAWAEERSARDLVEPVRPPPEDPPDESARFDPAAARGAGVGLMIGGGLTAVVGFVGNTTRAQYAWTHYRDDPESYEQARRESDALLVVGIVGSITVGTGLVLAIAGTHARQGSLQIQPGPVTTIKLRF